VGNNKKEDTSNNPPVKLSELEARIENLQKSIRDKEHTIAELKDKSVKQEKKIDDQTRAKSVMEKDASVKELKERITHQQLVQQQQQKKDDQTRARLALPDSPVVKAVLDATLQENKDLHLRIQAMVLQAQEEKKTVSEISQMIENYRHELAVAESRNQALEQELQAAKAETLRIQRQIAHLRDPLTPDHFISHATSTTDIPTPALTIDTNAATPKVDVNATTPKTDTNASNVDATRAETATQTQTTPSQPQPTTPRTPYVVPPLKPTSQMHIHTTPAHTQPSTPPTSQPNTSSTSKQAIQTSTPVHTHHTSTGPVSPRANGTSSFKEANTATPSNPPISPRDELAELESYDLSKLAKELDANSLASSSLSDLMDSLDNGSPMQALDFISLAQDKNQAAQPPSLMSPTARVEMGSPFKGDNGYDKDFINILNCAPCCHLSTIHHFGCFSP
jgi:hypothetical protein